jgi:hypothetical protein
MYTSRHDATFHNDWINTSFLTRAGTQWHAIAVYFCLRSTHFGLVATTTDVVIFDVQDDKGMVWGWRVNDCDAMLH